MPKIHLPGEDFTPSPPDRTVSTEMTSDHSRSSSAHPSPASEFELIDSLLRRYGIDGSCAEILKTANAAFDNDFVSFSQLAAKTRKTSATSHKSPSQVATHPTTSSDNIVTPLTQTGSITKPPTAGETYPDAALSSAPLAALPADRTRDVEVTARDALANTPTISQQLSDLHESADSCTNGAPPSAQAVANSDSVVSRVSAMNADDAEKVEQDQGVRRPLLYSSHPSDLEETAPDELGLNTEVDYGWLWQGYLMRGGVTVLVSSGKVGKTTLLTVLLKKIELGGTLAGVSIERCRALFCTEEPNWLWSKRHEKYQFGPHVRFHSPRLRPRFTHAGWDTLEHRCRVLAYRRELELLILDPMSFFVPYQDENNALQMQDAFKWVRNLADFGLSVLLVHHPSKGSLSKGSAVGRGSSVIGSMADIIVDMKMHPAGDPGDRRRILTTWSRYPGYAPSRTIEWTADESDYISHDPQPSDSDLTMDVMIHRLLRASSTPLKITDLLRLWPSRPRPSRTTLQRRLNTLTNLLTLHRTGTATRLNPYQYFLPPESKRCPTRPLDEHAPAS